MAAIQAERRKAPRADDSELRGRRALPRAQIVLPASVDTLSGYQHIQLIDVSQSGARLEGADLPEVGKDVVLKCGGIDTFGTVVWAIAERCGIHFDEPIGAKDLVALRHIALAADRSGITPEEHQAMDDWMNGFAR